MSLRPPTPQQPSASAPVVTTAGADGGMANEQVLAELQGLREAEEARAQSGARTPKRIVVGLLLGVLALIALWSTGRMDPWLSQVGLNKNACLTNGFGATFCGDDATAYQARIASITGDGNATPATTTPAPAPSYGGRLGDKSFALDSLQVKDDGIGDIGGTVRITNVSAIAKTMTFTVTFFQGSTVIGSAMGSAADVSPGRTVTAHLVSQDPVMSGPFRYQFQVDVEF